MRCLRCGKCCRDVRMPLSMEDLRRLERLGLHREDFSTMRNGVTYLRNVSGRCVFLRGDSTCSAYQSRPLGCRLYPIVCDDLKGVVADRVCSAWRSVTQQDVDRARPKLLKLIGAIYGSGF